MGGIGRGVGEKWGLGVGIDAPPYAPSMHPRTRPKGPCRQCMSGRPRDQEGHALSWQAHLHMIERAITEHEGECGGGGQRSSRLDLIRLHTHAHAQAKDEHQKPRG